MDKIKREKTGGRRKGTANVKTKALRQAIQDILDNNVEQYQEDLNAMSPKDRVNAINNLMKFSLPQLKAQDIKLDASVNGVDEDVVSDILEGLKNTQDK